MDIAAKKQQLDFIAMHLMANLVTQINLTPSRGPSETSVQQYYEQELGLRANIAYAGAALLMSQAQNWNISEPAPEADPRVGVSVIPEQEENVVSEDESGARVIKM